MKHQIYEDSDIQDYPNDPDFGKRQWKYFKRAVAIITAILITILFVTSFIPE